MAQREYRELSCREVGSDCDFMVRAETKDEVLSLISEHACRAHKVCAITPDFKDLMESSAKSVWCDRECYSAPRLEMKAVYWG